MNKVDFKLFCAIARMTQQELHRSMRKYLRKKYSTDKVMITKDFILCEGNIPVMVTAHMDTVFKSPPVDIYHDSFNHVIWSPQGLGADDRAGVFAIMKLVDEGWRPHILLTTDEEIGGIGAQSIAMIMPKCLLDTKYIIELDRQGDYDCVFYSCANEKFQKYIERFGFITNTGSFSDISVVCPQWEIAGVNLSIGYRREHTSTETLHTIGFYSTLRAVIKMFKDIKNAEYFEYIPDPDELAFWSRYGNYTWGFPGEDDYFSYNLPQDMEADRQKHKVETSCACWDCRKPFETGDVFEVQSRAIKGTHFYCIDCVSKESNFIEWCSKCGRPFEQANNDEETLCYECRDVDKRMDMWLY